MELGIGCMQGTAAVFVTIQTRFHDTDWPEHVQLRVRSQDCPVYVHAAMVRVPVLVYSHA
jgi:hypothetical protein